MYFSIHEVFIDNELNIHSSNNPHLIEEQSGRFIN